ncbi:MAG TPA: MupA/Atu3671 family FMN-dependent luciferase-like monooxygenase [Acidimicrobiales bacterium]|nr:MupA/Atu3671 family FMN-dependent luciferase-like monooxygenase [Acidimicrobiales bacterium]
MHPNQAPRSVELVPQDPRRCVIVGDQTLALECAELAVAAGLQVVALASRHAQAAETGARLGFDVRDDDRLSDGLGGIDADVLLSIANLRIVPHSILRRFDVAINFHDGPLPKLAGVHATSWALAGGAREHAITWHLMTETPDAGDIVLADQFAIADDDTAYTLNARCFERALATFPTVAAALATGRLLVSAQSSDQGEYHGRHERFGARSVFDPRRSVRDLRDVARALDFGPRIVNPLGAMCIVSGADAWLVDVREATSDGHAHDGLAIEVEGGSVVIGAVTSLSGAPVDAATIAGSSPELTPSSALCAALDAHDGALSRSEVSIRSMLATSVVTPIAGIEFTGDIGRARDPRSWSSVLIDAGASTATHMASAAVLWLARTFGDGQATVAIADTATREIVTSLAPLARRPLMSIGPELAHVLADDFVEQIAARRDRALASGPWLADLVARDPGLRTRATTEGNSMGPLLVVDVDVDVDDPRQDHRTLVRDPAAVLHLRIGAVATVLDHATDAIDAATAARAAEQIAALAVALHEQHDVAVGALTIATAGEQAMLNALNATERALPDDQTVITSFLAQVERTPDAPAVTANGITLTFRDLAADAARIAGILSQAGVGRGCRVGLALARDEHLLPSILAVLTTGAAYVPLDLAFPEPRLRTIVDDARLDAVVANDQSLGRRLAGPSRAVVSPAANGEADRSQPTDFDGPRADDAAYVIYTSGSTGMPKGVVVEHRNVVNFFVAMDEVIRTDPPGVWMAVTSISFDISVLELLWTICRGYRVVVRPDAATIGNATARTGCPTFSLFYFASAESDSASGYRLLLDGARFADDNGFEAVWTPERHFHAFGGIYPNPSVTSAAIAAVTTRVGIRAGSVVLPLHSPVRVAEEWAVVDNLSDGRVGISVASGWQPNDFVLNVGGFEGAKGRLDDDIDALRRLWRGEAVTLPGPLGPVEVRTFPRPRQPEIPLWLTSAGSIETFERAGRLGCNLLTHLLGQSIEQLRAKIAAYRDAWRRAGHHGDGRVTLMVHTFLSDDRAEARAVARPALTGYLRSATSLLKDMASAFPTLRNAGPDADEYFRSLRPSELDELLAAATDRYMDTSGLFGTIDDAQALVFDAVAAGVDEIACLVDFGVDAGLVRGGFTQIAALKERIEAHFGARSVDTSDMSVGGLIHAEQATHLQCTPSMLAMLVADPTDGAALGKLDHLLIGGEMFTPALAGEALTLLNGRLTNMYGPTETTVWSLVHEVQRSDVIPIGRPIANTTVHVVDSTGAPAPVGVAGELLIGGAGVTRGYHDRGELTAARFVDHPRWGRVYATGDRAIIQHDGVVDFGGRLDNQVKVRGYRIELGEIEAALEDEPQVARAVVVAIEVDSVNELVAFITPKDSATFDLSLVQRALATRLPEPMIPRGFDVRDSLPKMPNGKTDRVALAKSAPAVLTRGASSSIGQARPSPTPISVPGLVDPHEGETSAADEAAVIEVWSTVLGRAIQRNDNFFEVGGHSLLAVKVFRLLGERTAVPLALTDIFRFPSARLLGAHIAALRPGAGATNAKRPDTTAPAATAGDDRGARRRNALLGRGRSS